MPKAEEYHHIAAWGRVMGSFPYYIRDEQERAAEANAPLNAIHRPKEEGEPWGTADEIKNDELRERVNDWAEEHRRYIESK